MMQFRSTNDKHMDRWSPEDLHRLDALLRSDRSLWDIALELGRTTTAVHARLRRMQTRPHDA